MFLAMSKWTYRLTTEGKMAFIGEIAEYYISSLLHYVKIANKDVYEIPH